MSDYTDREKEIIQKLRELGCVNDITKVITISTEKQFKLARPLLDELQKLGE